ncbi:hypothetical protein [Eisenibacter elegans]|jgi:DNA-binding CsgD family transcriptional regulator|uniref:hypothetical protein n=1 Tax=Eisenibacter elegans TaxID=997 RepID=UPI000478C58B|nr:hypothetical protein [Eisenibacter elegans]
MNKYWSKKHQSCISCGTTEIKHRARGLCQLCYLKAYRQGSLPLNEGIPLISEADLRHYYCDSQMSLAEIAAMYHTNRTTVYNYLIRYSIPPRDKRQAHLLAVIKGKTALTNTNAEILRQAALKTADDWMYHNQAIGTLPSLRTIVAQAADTEIYLTKATNQQGLLFLVREQQLQAILPCENAKKTIQTQTSAYNFDRVYVLVTANERRAIGLQAYYERRMSSQHKMSAYE